MEALTRLVSDSLARHGLDRPVDPRRLQWSRWFRCDSPHSLLVVPSRPGIFAIAEEITDLPIGRVHAGTAALESLPRAESRGPTERSSVANPAIDGTSSGVPFGGAALQRCEAPQKDAALAAEGRRMLAVLQFSEDDNMAFVMDRMFTYANPMRARLHAGNCFVRFVVVEDQHQRRGICAALNQWMRNSAEKASGIATDFSSSLELSSESVVRAPSPAIFAVPAIRMNAATSPVAPGADAPVYSSHAGSGASKRLRCPQPFPSGF
jgi:hypothetical protein